MGFVARADQRILLLLVTLLLLCSEECNGGPTPHSFVNNNFCRNHIFSPRCRGQQKRDLSSHSYRFPSLEDIQRMDQLGENSNYFEEFIRKLAPPDYEESF